MKGAYTLAGLALIVALFGVGYSAYNTQKVLDAVAAIDHPVGATPTAVFDADCLFNGGTHLCNNHVTLRTASTTPAAIRAPLNATSTVQMAQLQLNVSSTTATYWDIGIAPTPYATTTVVGSLIVAAGAQTFIQASTSPAAGNKVVVPPGYYIVAKEAGGITAGDTAGTGFIPSGSFEAEFAY